jgi:hypothetical protein
VLLRNVALVSEVPEVPPAELTRVAAALQKQVMRDFGPIWEVQATVSPFVSLDDVPLGTWPIIIQTNIGFDAAGIHLDKDRQPFALVQHSDSWALTASHELLEMLADPFGSRLVAGDSIKPGQGRVEYLVEVCDPSEAPEFGYTVNGILLSDFYTPRFFDPVAAPSVRYSFTGAIKKPREVLRGGYISWHDPVSDHWFQQTFFGTKKFRDLGQFTNGAESLRSWIDRRTQEARAQVAQEIPEASRAAALVAAAPAPIASATSAKAQAWRAQIAALTAGNA